MALAAGLAVLAAPVLRLYADPSSPGASGHAPSAAAFAEFQRRADPAVLALASRLDGERRAALGGRAEGWAVLDLRAPPLLATADLTPDAARRVNGFLPASDAPVSPATPFRLLATGPERERAVLCLTQAIYYEAALEPTAGQQAVAQAVLNRVRNPNFPKSICGVVYQGSSFATGCQFTFTCDGSRDRAPVAAYWNRAGQVAEQALSGEVMPEVGTATHYHADYVFPRWGPTLVKIGQIGAHIFYRFPGPAGQPASFHAPYLGGELAVSMAGPSREAILAARAAKGAPSTVELAQADPAPAEAALPPIAPIGHPAPSKDEIARINANLAKMDQAAAPIVR